MASLDSKAGKSLLAVSGAAPRLLLDAESAARFLPIRAVEWDPRNPPPQFGDRDGPDTAVVTIRHYDDARRAYEWLHAGKHQFRSLAVDSISELQQRYIEAIAGRGTVKIDQWGSIFREVGGLIRDLRDLTTHPVRPLETVAITAMTKEVEGVYRPLVNGQLMSNLPYYLDLIGWLYVDTDPETGEEKRYLLTRKRPKYVAGERVGGRIPPVVELPTVDGTSLESAAVSNTSLRQLQRLVFPTPPPKKAAALAVVKGGEAVAATEQEKQEEA